MTPKLHYFNLGHETHVLMGKAGYTPSANVRKMMQDLALLPVWYSDPGDWVLTDKNIPDNFYSVFPEEIKPYGREVTKTQLFSNPDLYNHLVADPWGLSPQSLLLFQELFKKGVSGLIIPEWKEEYIYLTGRQSSAHCYEEIKEHLPEITFPSVPLFFRDSNQIEEYLSQQKGPFVVKTPYSSSGRGLLWLTDQNLTDKEIAWMKGAIKKQGVVSIEGVLDKVQDFAMEFYSDGVGNISYEGLSLFNTQKRGAYEQNILMSEKRIVEQIINRVGERYFNRIRETVITVLEKHYASVYTGYLGVDMMIYQDKQQKNVIHPCIEINMRHTMGLLATRLCSRYLASDAQGIFTISYENKPGEASRKHQLNTEKYPLCFENGKLKRGYFSLCPVTPDTNYTASILLN